MGDIINSDPAYVKDIDYGYSSLPGGTPGKASYSLYRAANLTREPMVYVGANDGMLHGFIANSGVEDFAYVPYGVYSNLSKLTAPTYAHKFFVDGGITVGDAYLGGSWKTILVAGLNAGGNTVYAIDVTQPGSTDDSDVLWEFSEANMGQSYSQPQIGILENGDWVAVFGNGYNSSTGGAYLYVVDLKTGTLLQKIQASDIAGNEDNGLSTPLLYDKDNNHLIDTIYAGDLLGNMWKFDVSGASGSWNVAFSGSPLFTARGPTNAVQSITAQPKATAHPLSGGPGGHIVMFGTGRYLTFGDVSDKSVQTFYGIGDDGVNPVPMTINRNLVLEQQIINWQTPVVDPANPPPRQERSFTGNSPDWLTKKGWYMDLLDPSPAPAFGERVISTSLVKEDRVIFVTAVPSSDPCVPGGSSWLMELNFLTGGIFTEPVIDRNKDGKYDDLDNVENHVIGGVRNQGLGISKTPVWLQANSNTAFKIMTGTSGGFATERNRTAVPPPPGGGNQVIRRSWVQIR
jgi:type IV pilus assembly protein PilY1